MSSAQTVAELQAQLQIAQARIAALEKPVVSGYDAFLNAVVENTNDIVWGVGPDYRLLFANSVFSRAIELLLGYPLAPGDSLLGHPALAAVTGGLQLLFERAAAGGPFTLVQPSLLRPGGTSEWYLNPIRDAGVVVGVACRVVDITEQQEVAAQIRASEERLRLVIENSPNPLMIWDGTGALTYISPSVTEELGFNPQAMIDDNALLHPYAAEADAPAFTPEFLAELNARNNLNARAWYNMLRAVDYCMQHPGEKVRIEGTVQTRFGVRDLQGTFQGFRNGTSGCEVVASAHDITAHRQLQRILEDANAELEQRVAERTAALSAAVEELQRANAGKDAFLAAISHELRTPLMGILSMGELLLSGDRGPLNPDQARFAAAVVGSGQRLLATLNNVLLYTQLIAGAVPIQHELCQLDVICAAVVRALADKAAARRQRITRSIDPPDLQVVGDYQGITNLLKMLLDNAIKFTPEEGSIHVTAAPTEDGDVACITVEDSGIGMTPEEVDGLFRPFSQADKTLARRYGGVGIGLAYVQKMVDLLGGTVAVASKPGQGSSFTVFLPMHAPG